MRAFLNRRRVPGDAYVTRDGRSFRRTVTKRDVTRSGRRSATVACKHFRVDRPAGVKQRHYAPRRRQGGSRSISAGTIDGTLNAPAAAAVGRGRLPRGGSLNDPSAVAGGTR